MRDSHNFGALRKQFFQSLAAQDTFFVNVKYFKRGFFALAKQLPGNQVGVVFGYGNHHFVSFVDEGLPERESHQVHSRRGARGENDLLPAVGIQETAHLLPSVFIGLGCNACQIVDGPMNIRVLFLGQLHPAFRYRQRALGGSGIVQIHQRLSVYARGKGRKLTADLF